MSLANLRKYYWRVSAYNAGGESSFTTANSFTTIVAVPQAPMLISPVDTTGQPRRTTFIWFSSALATKYHLQVATDSVFDSLGAFKSANVVFDTTLADTSRKLSNPLAAQTKYYWHVAAIDTGGVSAYSATAEYTTGTGIDAVDRLASIPKEFRLYQNYPNPFNPSTTINYDVPKASHVTIIVYNLLGQKVTMLVDMMMDPGSYKAVLNGSQLSSGVYFYRINAGTFVDTKKFILLK
jgi:hypothetical protein